MVIIKIRYAKRNVYSLAKSCGDKLSKSFSKRFTV